MKFKSFTKYRNIVPFSILFCIANASNVYAYTPNAIDAVDATDLAYLQSTHDATTLNPVVNPALTTRESSVSSYETADSGMSGGPVREVVFVGSSTIAYWSAAPEDLVTDMKDVGTNTEMSLVNRAMGGSVLAEQLYYFDRLVLPHTPKVVAFYCANDIDDKTTDYIFELIRYYEYKIHAAWPNTVFCIVSFNPSISTQAIIDSKIRPMNTILSEWADYRPNTEFVNSFDALINTNGTLNTSLFRVDGLHLNSTGYQLIKPIYKIKINDILHMTKGYPVMRVTGF